MPRCETTANLYGFSVTGHLQPGIKLFTRLNSKNFFARLCHLSRQIYKTSNPFFFCIYIISCYTTLSQLPKTFPSFFLFSSPSQSNDSKIKLEKLAQRGEREREERNGVKRRTRRKSIRKTGGVRFRRIDVGSLVYSRVLATVYALFNGRLYLSSR